MKLLWRLTILALLAFAAPQGALLAQSGGRVVYLKPQYLPPAELARVLGVRDADGRGLLAWQAGDGNHSVEVRRNDAANLLMVMGASDDVAAVEAMVKAVDVAPRQIALEARIVEVDRDKALDAGIDWSAPIVLQERVDWGFFYDRVKRGTPSSRIREDRTSASAGAFSTQTLMLLDRAGAATFRDAPRILTLNNRRATILDGQRVTYVTRYSSFTNLFETDTLDAGLTLSVLPSLGESGYLTLDVRAELTSVTGNISGSPVKDGQIVENTVIIKDGETVLLGGFLRTVEQHSHRRFPVLGYVLPFLFSRDTSTKTRRESFVAITPRVVDLAAAVDEKTKGVIEGRPEKKESQR